MRAAIRLSATVTLLNPVAPMEYFVTDGGFLMTLDNWHNMGYSKVVVIYSPSIHWRQIPTYPRLLRESGREVPAPHQEPESEVGRISRTRAAPSVEALRCNLNT